MSIEKRKAGQLCGKEVFLYTLDNKNGLTAEIYNYGGIIKSLVFKGTDVVLGRDNFEEYLNNDGYYGALIGRNCNRIGNAEVAINGKIYKLSANQNGNNLHGGFSGFDKKVWTAQEKDVEEPSLKLTLTSPDGEEGFPGEVQAAVTYTLTKENALTIHYEGVSDKDTVLNMTNHSFFNLNGHDSGTIYNHTLQLKSSFYTPSGERKLPNGEVRLVDGTVFDFRTEKLLGTDMKNEAENGFDDNFVLDGAGYRFVGEVKGDNISMHIYTDSPALQLYTGNFIVEDRICKNGKTYPKHGAVCFETQAFPNWNNYSHFPGGLLKKGEKYSATTSFQFREKND